MLSGRLTGEAQSAWADNRESHGPCVGKKSNADVGIPRKKCVWSSIMWCEFRTEWSTRGVSCTVRPSRIGVMSTQGGD